MWVTFALMANWRARETLVTCRLVELDIRRRLAHHYPALLNHLGIDCIEVELTVRNSRNWAIPTACIAWLGDLAGSGALCPKKAAR